MRIRSGQTMLELVIASGVIVTSVIASATLIISTISAARVEQSNVEAANYAREGIEVIRSIRDSNLLKSERNIYDCTPQPCTDNGVVQWDDAPMDTPYIGYTSLGGSGTPSYYVATDLTPDGWVLHNVSFNPVKINDVPDSPPGTPHLRTQSWLVCATCTPTRFSRIIKVEKEQECIRGCPGAPSPDPVYVDRLHVTSFVAWNERTGIAGSFIGFNRTLVADAYLYNWR